MTELWQVPQYTLDDYETKFADRHLIHGVVAKWARERGDQAALTDAAGRRVVRGASLSARRH